MLAKLMAGHCEEQFLPVIGAIGTFTGARQHFLRFCKVPRAIKHRSEVLKSNPFRIGIGMGGAGSNGAAGVGVSSPSAKNVREGTLVLRVIDPARNAEVWNGRVSRELGKGGPPDPALIQRGVADLLKDFPSPGSLAQ